MADKIVLNTPQYKGEYDLDVEEQELNAVEWRWVKKISDYLPLTIAAGFEGGDHDLYVAFAVIALFRAGRIQKQEALAVAEYLSDCRAVDGVAPITFIGGAAEEEEASDPQPPAKTPDTETPLRSIGGSSRQTLDPSEDIHAVTGVPA